MIYGKYMIFNFHLFFLYNLKKCFLFKIITSLVVDFNRKIKTTQRKLNIKENRSCMIILNIYFIIKSIK